MPKHVKDMLRLTELQGSDLSYAIREDDGLTMDKSVPFGVIKEYCSGTEPHNLNIPSTEGLSVTNYAIPTPVTGRDVMVFLKVGSATNFPVVRITEVGIEYGSKVLLLNDSLSNVQISAGPSVTFQDDSEIILRPKDALWCVRTNDNKLHVFPLRSPISRVARRLDLDNTTGPVWIGNYQANTDLFQTNTVLDTGKSEIVVRPLDDNNNAFHISGYYQVNATGTTRYSGAAAQILQSARNAWIGGVPTWEPAFYQALTESYTAGRMLMAGQCLTLRTDGAAYALNAFAVPATDNYYHLSTFKSWNDLLGNTVAGTIKFDTTIHRAMY